MAINIFMTLGHHILGSHIRDRSIQSSLHLGIVSLVNPLLNAFRARLSSLIISIPKPPRINGHQYYTLSLLILSRAAPIMGSSPYQRMIKLMTNYNWGRMSTSNEVSTFIILRSLHYITRSS